MNIACRYFSECGPRRKNEDYVAIRKMAGKDRAVFVLCDGMGGHENGEIASRLVADNISDFWLRHSETPDSQEKIIAVCEETMGVFNAESKAEMGTTMAMVAIENDNALIAHCGDSRIYVVRDRNIIYQSTDHVALTSEGWPIITRAFFTGRSNFIPDVKAMKIQSGDIILICSDGVYGNAKWSDLNDALIGDNVENIFDKIRTVAEKNAHDNYSAIFITIGNP